MKDKGWQLQRDASTQVALQVQPFYPSSFIPYPWTLRGSALVMLTRLAPRHRTQSLLSFGVRALVHYEYSPVGAYDEMAIAVLSKYGPTIVQMPVTSPDSVIGGRANWGFPKTLLRISWKKRGKRIEFHSPHQTFRARVFGISIPIKVRLASTQMFNQKRVRVPVAIGGRARLAFCGRQISVFIENFEMVVGVPEYY